VVVLAPPIAFVIVLAVTLAGFAGASRLPQKRKGSSGALAKPYASGETMERSRFQPDYGQFFPFAFFFTILHVVTLMVASSPARTIQSAAIAAVYVVGALLGLFILFRR